MDFQKILSVIAGILFLAATIPYVRAILRKETRPMKSTWIIWASLDTITLAGMIVKDSVNGQIIGAIIGAWLVAGLAIRYGKAGWSLLDKVCLGGAIVGIILWQTMDSNFAIMASLGTMFVGSIPTFVSAWRNPKGEDRFTWTLCWISCVIAMFAIPKWTIEDAAQPIVFMVIESTMVFLLWVRPKFKQ